MIAVRPDPELVKGQLGHSSITVTYDRYGHLLPDARHKMADDLDRLFDVSSLGTRATVLAPVGVRHISAG